MVRDYDLSADGTRIATPKRGETQTVQVPEGAKKLRAHIDWCSSHEVDVAELGSKKIVVKNTFSGRNALLTSLFALYCVSFGRRQHLTIERAA